MSDQGQRFQHRWNFRRTETDVDSSSDDDNDNSRSDSASDPKLMKHNPVNCQFSVDAHQTMVSPTSFPKEEKQNNSSFEEPNRNPNQSKARSRTKRTTSNHEPSDASFIDLRGYMESLVEEIKTARKDLLVWMSNEMTSSSKDDVISPKPRKGQRQNAKRGKTPRNNNPNKGRRRRSGTVVTQNQTNEEAVPPKEGENVVIDAKPVEKTEKKKGKGSRLCTKKRKIDAIEAVEQTDKTVAAAADDCVTLSTTILPQKEVLNSEKNPSEVGNGTKKRNALNSGVNLSSHHLNFDLRTQQKKDGVLAQNPVEDGNERDGVKRNALNPGVNLSSHHLNFDPRDQQKEDGNGRDGVKRNALNSGVNLSSHQLNFDPRTQQKDVVFAQNPVEDGKRRDSLNSGVNLSSHHLNFDLRSQQKDEVFSQNPSEDGNERDGVKRNALNPEFNLSSHHLNFDLRNQQKDAVFAQNGLRNPSDYYGQNTCPTTGHGFPFPFVHQGSNSGNGMSNISSQFGQPYLTHGNRMSGMFMEPPLFLNGNHAFKESYGGLNQPLKFNNVQQGGLQSPDIRRGAFNQQQGTKTNQ
ncbi:hypothetical protein SOVF_015560 [Spinacia oleracea]|nr:hypothetical protein SOVF_015560 [Spinacia oleracea]